MQESEYGFPFPCIKWASLVAQMVKNLPAVQETWVWFLCWEVPPGAGIGYPLQYSWASLVAQTVKNLPAMRETWVRSLDWEDLLEEGMATYSNILPWKVAWTEEPGKLRSMRLQRVEHHWSDWACTTQHCKAIILQLKKLKKITYIHAWLNHFTVQQKLSQHCKSTKLQ